MEEYPKTPKTYDEAVQTLVDFVRTAPGCLPERVTVALDLVRDLKEKDTTNG